LTDGLVCFWEVGAERLAEATEQPLESTLWLVKSEVRVQLYR
jgi:hypothetical protein